MQELLIGNNGRVRAAVIKVTDHQNKTRLLRRSMQHLIPIEVIETGGLRSSQLDEKVEETPPPTLNDNDDASTDEVVTTGRPRRRAAVVGELNR